jgi:hypothetical protein
MDALSGYSSDDSEDDALRHTSALSALVAYNDEDDEDDTDEVHKPLPKKVKLSQPAPSPTIVSVLTSATRLPPPPLGSHSLITSEVDHFSLKYGTHTLNSAIPIPSKLQQLLLSRSSCSTSTTLNHKANTTTNISWAEEIKSQHDFCNPALFQTAVENFGIRNVLGSNMHYQENVMEDYEFDLVRLEEEARLRQQQQQQHVAIETPTPFAQEQLERAMLLHRRL